jgi:hypothetical protein
MLSRSLRHFWALEAVSEQRLFFKVFNNESTVPLLYSTVAGGAQLEQSACTEKVPVLQAFFFTLAFCIEESPSERARAEPLVAEHPCDGVTEPRCDI